MREVIRQLLRAPAFSAAAVVTLALGIAANTACFAAINAIVFRPARAQHLDNVWTVTPVGRGWMGGPLSEPHIRLLEANMPPEIEAVDHFVPRYGLAHVPGHAERINLQLVSGGHARVFDLHPQSGRFIDDEDYESARRVAVISDRLWREWFGGRRDVAGQMLRVDDKAFEIVGVAPVGYRGFPAAYRGLEAFLGSTDAWIPVSTAPAGEGGAAVGSAWRSTVVRTHPAVDRDVVAEHIRDVVAKGPKLHGQDDYRIRLGGLSANPIMRRVGFLLLGLSSLVLLAACANLANMLYTRAVHRAAEIAVRQSLGATSMRIFRMFLAETIVIAGAASALGLALALGATRALNRAFPAFRDLASRITIDLTPDYRVFAFAFVSGTAAALAVGVITAWRASRVPPLRAMASGDAATSITLTSRRVRLALVALQVTGAVVLLMGAGLYLQQTRKAFENRITFDTRPLAAAHIELARHGYNDQRAQAFLGQLLAKVHVLPGMDQAVIADGIPGGISMGGAGGVFAAERVLPGVPERRYIDGSHRRAGGMLFSATPGFLAAIGLPLEQGRPFAEGDGEGAPLVVIVSRSLAASLWPGGNALGKRMMIGNEGQWRTVVGIAADPAIPKDFTLTARAENLVLVPLSQRHLPPLTEREVRFNERFRRELLVVMRSDRPKAQIDALRAAVNDVDETVAIFGAATLDESLLSWMAPLRAARLLVLALALLALSISIAGVYSVLAFIVARRMREFGIRIALGAARRQVLRLVIDDAVHLLLVGLLAGTFVAAVGERLIDHRAFGVLPNDELTWAAVLLLILTVGLVAAWVPARRAASVDPSVALRDL